MQTVDFVHTVFGLVTLSTYDLEQPALWKEGQPWQLVTESAPGSVTTMKKSLRTSAPSASAPSPAKSSSAAKNCPWVMSRQALVKHYMWPSRYSGLTPETVLDDWNIFVQDIKVHSGKHRHQGGLVIYIIEGEGWSEVDGERHDWEAGDLLLLPLKPGGVEHKHYNRYDDKPAKWIAFISGALFEWGASEMVQLENHPDFKAKNIARSAR